MSYIYRSDNPAAEQALYQHIGQRIKAERDALGFNQIDLAQEVGLLRTSIANIEAGRQRLPIYMLYRIAEALGVPVTNLLPTQPVLWEVPA